MATSNFVMKDQLIRNTKFTAELFPYHIQLTIHDVPVRIHTTSEKILKLLEEHYPLSWQKGSSVPAIDIFWQNSRDLGLSDEQWEDQYDPNCQFHQTAEGLSVCQRDFAAFLKGHQCHLICPYFIGDGFFNFLRWLLPLHFINSGKMLLHSSCVLDGQNQAYFSIGYSGAGKSTIASFAPREKVLGDDMNVIKIERGQCWAQAGALGQALLNPREYAHWYPVRALFWLKKSEDLQIKSVSRALQLQYLCTSVANVFWDQLSLEQTQIVFQRVQEILQHVELYELAFPKDSKIWQTIFLKLNQGSGAYVG